MESVESQIAEWRAYVASAPGVNGHDVDELEDHLRHQIAELTAAGLDADEGFLVAVKRMGDVDTLSREFAREHSGRLWKQLRARAATTSRRARRPAGSRRSHSLPPPPSRSRSPASLAGLSRRGADLARAERSVCSCCRSSPRTSPADGSSNRGTGCCWRCRSSLAALVVNLYPWAADSDTEALVVLSLPVALWFVVAYPYMGGTTPIARAAHGLRPLHGRVVHLLRADRARRRACSWRLTAAILEPTPVDVERGRRLGAAFGSGGCSDRCRMARRVEADGSSRTWRRCSR